MTDLPFGWVEKTLDEVAVTQLGRMLSASRETGEHPKPYLRNRDVQWGHINVTNLPVMDFSPGDKARFFLRPGDVLVCEGGEVGRAAIWAGQLSECYYQKALHRVRTSHALMPEFLRYLLEHYSRTKAFERFTSGSTIAHLPQEDLRNLPVPTPPMEEQRRIVATVEEQFSRLDAGAAALAQARKKLKQIRAAVLQTAVTGRLVSPDEDTTGAKQLVAQLRSEMKDLEIQRKLLPKVHYAHRMPSSWQIGVVADLARSIDYGTSEKTRPGIDGIPILRMGNLGLGTIDYENLKFLPRDQLDPRLLLRPGDLLFNRTNSPELVGKTAVFQGYSEDISFASYLIRIRPLPSAALNWVSIVLNSPIGREYIASVRSQQVGQANVNGRKLAAAPIPIPSAEEQSRIIAECDRLFTLINAMEEAVVMATARSERLRSSVLKVAFSGRLTVQDSTGESVCSLLARLAES